MSKYFIRFEYKTTHKVALLTYETTFEEEIVTESCIAILDDTKLCIEYIREYIFNTELHYLTNKPDQYSIDIIAMNRL